MAAIVVTQVHGTLCPDRLGAHYQGVVLYRGFDARRVTIHIPIVFEGFSVLDIQELKITTGAGMLRPRGDFSAHITDPIDLTINGTFEAALMLEDAEAFRVKLTEMAPAIDCTEVFRIALVRSG
jgi:hypothetical protein